MHKIETFSKYISLLMEAQDISFEADIDTVIQSNLNSKEIPKYLKYRLRNINDIEEKIIKYKELLKEIYDNNSLFHKKWEKSLAFWNLNVSKRATSRSSSV